MNELETATAVAAGDLAAPAPVGASFLVPMRISGTGVAFRRGADEFVYRDPSVWLSETMQRRVLGLPVILEHPRGSMVTADDINETFLGIIILSYVRGDELWGVARIFSKSDAETLAEGSGDDFTLDTSPAVSFAPGEKIVRMPVPGRPGMKLLVEHAPQIVDHLAVCVAPADTPGGVWSKGEMSQLGVVPSDNVKEDLNG